ncbi:radical SAM/SPASM domain-containing protein [Patescibacteria group bacterium]
MANDTKKAKAGLGGKLKNAAAKSGGFVLPHVPRVGLDLMVKQLRKKMVKHFDKNPEGLNERELRWKKSFTLKMLDVYLDISKDMSPNVRYSMVNNLANNAILKGRVGRDDFEEKEGFRPPSLGVMSPTMRCNLTCTGCYAFEYNKTKTGDLSYETMDRVCKELKSFGAYFVVITGGEPWIRKQDLLKLFKEHNDMYFITYTNGTLIDEATAKEIEKLGNVTPCISVEGYEKDTDMRRGEGVAGRSYRAMKYLKDNGVPFAISVTMTSNNAELVTSQEFYDFYIDKGCAFAWYFQYMPMGKKPDVDLMVTPAQRTMARRRAIEQRESDMPFLVADFWNDGVLTDGCIAAGRGYFHISGSGAIEPCVFAQFHVDNINDTTIREALKSEFFQTYRKAAEDVDDKFRPCGVIDHPENLRKAVKAGRDAGECVKHSCGEGGEALIREDGIAPQLNKLAEDRAQTIGKEWKNGEM